METKDDFSSLSELLSSEKLGTECLDFIEAHGYIAATVISPEPTNDDRLFQEILGDNAETVDEAVTESFRTGILQLKAMVSRQLLMAETLEMPCELDVGVANEPSDIERWCMAFVEKHFTAEDAWFDADESVAANLLLPVICGSGLVEDAEIDKIRADTEMYISMLEDIPELAVDMYAFYHQS